MTSWCNMKKYDIVALGELLIDFTEYGVSKQGNPVWEANPGGAPCNVLAMMKRLGKSAAFIGKIGNDVYGRQLESAVKEVGIDPAGLVFDNEVHTTLAVVHKLPNGDRDFSFYRNPGADVMLTEDEIDYSLLSSTKVFHFGTLSMTHEGVEQATKAAVKAAKLSGALVSFDPNFRPPLWNSEQKMLEAAVWGMGVCDILKISDNEIDLLTGEKDIEKAIAIIRHDYPNIRLLCVTMGGEGSYCSYKDMLVFVPAFRVNTVETTGAGDTYGACVLNYVVDHGIEALTEDNLREMMTFAGAAAALVTTRKGALRVMPTLEEIEKTIASR